MALMSVAPNFKTPVIIIRTKSQTMSPNAETSAADIELDQADEETPLLQKLYCGTGHVLNDLFLQMTASFNVVFFIKVAELDGSQTGIIMLVLLVVNAVVSPIAGYCSDMFTIPLLSRALGRRKAWHLIGTVVMVILFPLLFTRCLVCEDDSSWAKFAYYLTILVCANAFGIPNVNVGHLSMISVLAKSPKESVELNVLRTTGTYASGILAYAVTWIVLGKDSEDKLSPRSWKDFTTVNCILVAVGLIFSVIFHIGTKEPNEKKPREVVELLAKQSLISVATAFTLGSIEEEYDQEPSKQPEEVGEQRHNQCNDKVKVEGDQTTATDTATSGTIQKTRKSSFPQRIVEACHVLESDTKIISRTRKSWLKNRGLYRVGTIVAFTQLIVAAGYSYMPLYLTDYLQLQKESIAYFPLIVLISGLCGTVCSKLLERKLGSKWTYCLAASVLIGTNVCFYFISPSNAYLSYPAAILVGLTSSTMIAMSYAYLTDLIGQHKETAGFVSSFAYFMANILAGVFYMTVQIFYPKRSVDGGECEECASFARHVYTLTLAALTFLILLVVAFFQKSN